MSIKQTKDGRTIRTGKDYTQFRRDLHAITAGRCSECGRETYLTAGLESDWSFHTDHIDGRGGGKRNDSFGKVKGLCGKCHRIKHGQQRATESKLHWTKKENS